MTTLSISAMMNLIGPLRRVACSVQMQQTRYHVDVQPDLTACSTSLISISKATLFSKALKIRAVGNCRQVLPVRIPRNTPFPVWKIYLSLSIWRNIRCVV